MKDDGEVWFKLVVGCLILGAYCVNFVKMVTCALNDQIGLAIIHAVGALTGVASVITVWF